MTWGCLPLLRRSPQNRWYPAAALFRRVDRPMISGIPWISQIIQMAGGDDVFAGRSAQKAEQRIVRIEEVVVANPQIILASWCGKPLDIESILASEAAPHGEALSLTLFNSLGNFQACRSWSYRERLSTVSPSIIGYWNASTRTGLRRFPRTR
jgi:hypothetical protein